MPEFRDPDAWAFCPKCNAEAEGAPQMEGMTGQCPNCETPVIVACDWVDGTGWSNWRLELAEFSPFGRNDQVTELTAKDAELLSGEPEALIVLVPVEIEE